MDNHSPEYIRFKQAHYDYISWITSDEDQFEKCTALVRELGNSAVALADAIESGKFLKDNPGV